MCARLISGSIFLNTAISILCEDKQHSHPEVQADQVVFKKSKKGKNREITGKINDCLLQGLKSQMFRYIQNQPVPAINYR